MLPLSISSIIPGLRPLAKSPSSTPRSLPDAYDVGLNYDWSGVKSPGPALRHPPTREPTSSIGSPTPSIFTSYSRAYSSMHSTDPNFDGHVVCKEIPNLYGQHPIYQYQYGQAQSESDCISEQTFMTPKSSLFSPITPSLTPASRQTRPLFTPSRASTPLSLPATSLPERQRPLSPMNVRPAMISKRKLQHLDGERAQSLSLKRPRLDQDELISLSDEDEDYGVETYDTGYQRSVSDSCPLIDWTGPNGGRIKFIAKPANYDDKALSRWSYSINRPEADEDERLEGDIHFSPATLRASTDPFMYWVCIWHNHGPRWVRFQCGQPHPCYKGFVLQSAQAKTRTPPHWVKESSFRSSRRP
ncbi:hypothetical protein RhiJN_15083 [Ceratobasidium sp. AG-Ba]|nr:hypothetical protein RhiJN_15083 [Ceratobasidium sp. AG-Ba]